MGEGIRVALYMVLGFVAVGAFWCLIVWLISLFSGWQMLAEQYAAEKTGRTAGGTWRHAVTGRIGIGRYRNVLSVATTADGMFLDVMPFFRVGHPQLFIPLSAVSARRRVQGFFGELEQMDIGNPVLTSITLPVGLMPPATTSMTAEKV